MNTPRSQVPFRVFKTPTNAYYTWKNDELVDGMVRLKAAMDEAKMPPAEYYANMFLRESGLTPAVFDRISEDQKQAFIQKAKQRADKVIMEKMGEWITKELLPPYFQFTTLLRLK